MTLPYFLSCYEPFSQIMPLTKLSSLAHILGKVVFILEYTY